MLSKRPRSQTLSTISFINERNRKANVERAEEAIMEEVRASGGQKVEDPFTRRSTKPRMIHKPTMPGEVSGPPGTAAKLISAGQANPLQPLDPLQPLSVVKTEPGTKQQSMLPKVKTNDLFSAHDFDIKIDLEVPLPCKLHSVFKSAPPKRIIS